MGGYFQCRLTGIRLTWLLSEKMFSRLGSYLARILDFRDQTPEGFPLTGRSFVVPENALTLDPRAKRTVTICNLFANQHRSIKEIAELLDTATPQVIAVLGTDVLGRQFPVEPDV